MKLRTMVLVGSLGLCAPLASGCSVSNDSGNKQQTKIGTIEMDLGAVAPSGAAYRLRNANFVIVDSNGVAVMTLHSEEFALDAATISATLDAGDYTITLQDGWFMQRSTSEVVPAFLLAGASRSFSIFDDQTTPVIFSFKVEGEPITFSGTLDVSITVGECRQDPFEPNNTQAEAATISFVPTQASVCGDDDWYTFQLNVAEGTPVALTIDFQQALGDLDMRLEQPDGTLLVSQGTTDQERIEVAVQPGFYFLRVYGFLGALGDYTFNAALVPPM